MIALIEAEAARHPTRDTDPDLWARRQRWGWTADKVRAFGAALVEGKTIKGASVEVEVGEATGAEMGRKLGWLPRPAVGPPVFVGRPVKRMRKAKA